MKCLTDSEVQAVVDGEATEAMRAHAARCYACRERVAERTRDLAVVVAAAGGDEMSPAFEARMRGAMRDGGPTDGDSPDAELDVWAGHLPLVVRALDPVPDRSLRSGIPVPPGLSPYRRPGLVD